MSWDWKVITLAVALLGSVITLVGVFWIAFFLVALYPNAFLAVLGVVGILVILASPFYLLIWVYNKIVSTPIDENE